MSRLVLLSSLAFVFILAAGVESFNLSVHFKRLCVSFRDIPSFHLETKIAFGIVFRRAYLLLFLSHNITSFTTISLE